MGIDIIKNRKVGISLRVVWFVLFSIVMHSSYAQTRDCNIYEKSIMISTVDFPLFYSSLSSFYSDSTEYDYIHLIIEGGSGYSCLKRIYRGYDNRWRVFEKDTSNRIEALLSGVDTVQLKNEFMNIDTGQYVNLCSFTSLEVTHIYLIKERGKISFVLDTSPVSAEEIFDNRIINSAQFINRIELLFKSISNKLDICLD